MKFVLLSKNGDFLPILHKMHLRGAEVIAYVDQARDLHEGLTPTVQSALEIDVEDDDLVIFDMVGAGEAAEQLKSSGRRVFGGGGLNDKLELDRKFGTDFLQEHGIDIPPTWEFSTMDEVRQHLAESPARYVFKPNGNQETDLTYVSSSVEELLAVLPWLESRIEDGTEFELQEFVEGVEMSTEAWFTGERFLMPINSTMEEKKFMAGNVGPATGCMGNVVWAWDEETSQFLYEYLFKGMEDALRKAKYVGPIDINGIWNDEGIHALELTARFGYDAIQALNELLTVPMEEFLAEYEQLSAMPVDTGKVALAVRVSIPPFPSEGEVHKVPILGVEDTDHLYFSDVYYDKEMGHLRCAGADGYVVCVAVAEKTIEQARAKLYPLVEELEIPNKQYRIDIGERYLSDRREIERIIMTKRKAKKGSPGKENA